MLKGQCEILKGMNPPWAIGHAERNRRSVRRETYISIDDLCTGFSVSKSTAYNKSVIIRDALGMIQFDPAWCLLSLVDQNPLVWIIEYDGFPVDVRYLARDIQEIVEDNGVGKAKYSKNDELIKIIWDNHLLHEQLGKYRHFLQLLYKYTHSLHKSIF